MIGLWVALWMTAHQPPEFRPLVPGQDQAVRLVVCEQCQNEGERSTVQSDALVICTAMFCGGPWYDESGLEHWPEPCNTCTRSFTCSRGHKWAESEPSY